MVDLPFVWEQGGHFFAWSFALWLLSKICVWTFERITRIKLGRDGIEIELEKPRRPKIIDLKDLGKKP